MNVLDRYMFDLFFLSDDFDPVELPEDITPNRAAELAVSAQRLIEIQSRESPVRPPSRSASTTKAWVARNKERVARVAREYAKKNPDKWKKANKKKWQRIKARMERDPIFRAQFLAKKRNEGRQKDERVLVAP